MKSPQRCWWLLAALLIIPAAATAAANKDGLSSTSKGVSVPHTHIIKPVHAKHEEDENLNNEDDEIIPSSSSPSSSVAIGGSLSILQNVLASSAGPLLRSSARFAQLAICCYMAKTSWIVMKEVWEELSEEFSSLQRGRGGSDVREEQDMPYADDDALENNDDGSNGNNDKTFTPKTAATRELAARLRSAGILYASEASSEETRTVESIVRSLTRSEGNVLTQTLLTPLDGGLVDGEKQQSADSAAAAATQAWNNIGGLADAKESLLDLAFPLLPTSPAPGFEKNAGYYGGLLANPPGVLLYGPPGCGKSMLVRALAATVGARFLVVSPSCLLRKYVGETNLNVRALFSVARKIAPCVLFVDELDGLFRERGGEDHDVGRDLKTEFLQLWDGIRHHQQCTDSSSSILVIGATNRPFDVDPAFLRRMPRRVFVGLPDHDARISILQNMLKHVPLDKAFDLNTVAHKTGGYSPSDIREVLQAAALYPLREARARMMTNSADVGDNETPSRMQIPPLRSLTNDDVLRALAVAKPTHFSRKYQRQLMEYVRTSGGSRDSSPSVTNFDAQSGNYFFANTDSFNSNYGEEDDSSDYDEDSSDSDYDL
mmetsp:Transcript_4687/g.9802  ORF Transcript_4687/g.9802 Transcript_4687/m.9802 type:complete len:601 (+) Transcript_4687:1174-2976(+)